VKGKTNKLKITTTIEDYVNTRYNNYQPLVTSDPTDPSPPTTDDITIARAKPNRKTIRKRHAQHILPQLQQQESAFLDRSIIRTENERTELAKKTRMIPEDKQSMPTIQSNSTPSHSFNKATTHLIV
jgi:hypothetical protein